ncbi:MAG: hypothetical protein J6M66_11550 [Lachnospiraceae bacterium]|nr:hypothetical protein [Lachnospiraceae bacterium]
MLTDEQEEIISQAIRPLFEYLEQEVICDVARRISESLAYTRTVELEVEHLQKLGYSPSRIRKEVMKRLNSTPEYRKMVAKNTLDHKREVKRILKKILKSAKRSKKEILRDAANLAYFNDLKLWKQGGKTITDRSFLPQLVDAISKQTDGTFENLSGTTGFKTISGYEMLENLYRRELDKAMIKVTSGAFTREQAVWSTVHDLANSGLRTIDFSSGRSMHLDTAVTLAVRTGAHQLAAKIMDKNIESTGENLVYVSKHWGARNTGTGHANHAEWQGKVYYIKPGTDYSKEAERIGQDRIMDLWYATGYSADGAHTSDPLGLHGYNCRHDHYVWFEGISELTDHEEDPEPAPVMIDGKTYDYYAVTQKMREKERKIRALKREREACHSLKMDEKEKEVATKISSKIKEYEEFCEKARVKPDINRLRYESGNSDLVKTKAWEKYSNIVKSGANNLKEQERTVRYQDITKKWFPEAIANSHKVQDMPKYSVGDTTYEVDGHNVVLDYKEHEKEIAEILAREVGGEVFMVPRINNPAGISTPDYLFNGYGYDLKTLTDQATENTIFNRVKKAKKQAKRFIIDVTATSLAEGVISDQIEKIFWSENTLFVEEIVIVRENKIIGVFARK